MATTYAHWRFGEQAHKTLEPKYRKIVEDNRDIFNIGVHGPDIFFYYKCYKRNEVNKFGYDLHRKSFGDILKSFKVQYQTVDNKASAMSYILGILAHFVLDAYVHSFIQKLDESSDLSHGRIEAQFDRYLLTKDGYHPNKKHVIDFLHPTKEAAHTITQLYNHFDEKTIYRTIKDQRFFLWALKDTSDFKRNILIWVMKTFGAPQFIENIMGKEDDPRCKASNIRLEKYYNKALEHFPSLAKETILYLENDKPLSPFFNNTFAFRKDYVNIPILPYEEELKYKVEEFQK